MYTRSIPQVSVQRTTNLTVEEPLFFSTPAKKLDAPPNKINKNKMLSQKTKNNYIQTLHLNNIISTKDNILSYIKLSFSPLLSRRALMDTGACANVIGKSQFEELKKDKHFFKHIETEQFKWKHVKMAGGQSVEVSTPVLLN